ncbi:nucleotide kinase domain-containing protein [Rufibacter tibetensis]|uniref:5-hmdU DNA kinase helical domain-containing protein n=1 Tax=Rufibacter tibetensis TaxID=512763 RepID=A0A0P0C5I5_9BACT|nr:nucleotide kinase domain-containing protein [Rufibacter tibetensis]ALJ00205.1 hypothetical protein DC20_16065 [Rufibacter tibetensis]
MSSHFVKLRAPKRSNVYYTYWKFAQLRQQVFLNRIVDQQGPWTDDPILRHHRFTNVFRASDRVSQQLIKLQYEFDLSPKEVFFRTMLFKIFNKIETYRFLEKELGEVSYSNFNLREYDSLLTYRMSIGKPIYSAAYIMPSAGNVFGHKLKHSNHLDLLTMMMEDRAYEQIASAKSLESVYKIILSYPSFGRFLAFQYTIDLNYSSLINFSEMDFVVAGPGAKNGILKCFESLGDYSLEDTIRWMADNQEEEAAMFEFEAPNLGGRRMQLIDCQNVFCEVDKYLRVAHPEITGSSGRKRIKQSFKPSAAPIEVMFPPKWGVNFQKEK